MLITTFFPKIKKTAQRESARAAGSSGMNLHRTFLGLLCTAFSKEILLCLALTSLPQAAIIQEMSPALLSGTPELPSIQCKNLISQLRQVLSANTSSLSHLLACLHKPVAIIDWALQKSAASTDLSWIVRQLSASINAHTE